MTGDRCSTSCPSFSLKCKYSKYIPAYFTLGHLYYLSKLGTKFYRDDRIFLVKLLGGEINDDNLYDDKLIIDYLNDDVEYILDNTVYTIINSDDNNKKLSNKYHILNNFINKYKKRKKEEILSIENYEKVPIYVNILNELDKYDFNLFSFNKYMRMIEEFIFENKYKKELIFDIIEYILLDYIPKNTFDIPYISWNVNKLNNSLIPEVGNIHFLYKDLRKWTKERIKLANDIEKEKQVIVVDDIKWIWFNLLKENEKYKNISIIDLKYNDIIFKIFLDTFLNIISDDLYTTYVIYKNYTDDELYKIKQIVNYINYIFDNNKNIYTFDNIKYYFIDDLYKNQYKYEKDFYSVIVDDKKYIINLLHDAIMDIEKSNLSKFDKDKSIDEIKKILESDNIFLKDVINYILDDKYGSHDNKHYLKYLLENKIIIVFKLF